MCLDEWPTCILGWRGCGDHGRDAVNAPPCCGTLTHLYTHNCVRACTEMEKEKEKRGREGKKERTRGMTNGGGREQ